MGGGEGNLRHVVHRRVHLERHQPFARRKLGYLEKHKDYVKRAKDFHRKEDTIKKLQQKAFYKNEDEFAWAMLSHRQVNGRMRKKPNHLSEEELRLLESQDAKYITMREQIDKKAAAKLAEKLHFLDADKPNRHTIFFDDGEVEVGAAASSGPSRKRKAKNLKEVDIAAALNTHPALLGRTANRLTRRQLDTAVLADPGQVSLGAKAAYKELLHRQERAKRLGRVREELELRLHLRRKGRRRKVVDAKDGRPAIYKWLPERKR